MAKVMLLHGSDHRIETPSLEVGKVNNDYGRGFYCTEDKEAAREWACKRGTDGIVNRYEIEMEGLKMLDLSSSEYSVLHWIALLLANRTFDIPEGIPTQARKFLLDRFLVDTSRYDLVHGYRADDSYFAYAEAFVSNTLPLRGLAAALRLGELGMQTALVSKAAFDALRFCGCEEVDASIYFPLFRERDSAAREYYRQQLRYDPAAQDDIFVVDLMRGAVDIDGISI